jgi:hypothetical protein
MQSPYRKKTPELSPRGKINLASSLRSWQKALLDDREFLSEFSILQRLANVGRRIPK